jgi:gliding motility-associated-like protein
VADFAASPATPTSGCDTVCVDFIDLSTNNPTQWHWDFPGGNPSTSTVKNPSNICYDSDGLYDVILTVTNDGGTDSTIKYSFVNVTSVPTATVNGDTIMKFGDSYQLHATGGVSYYWFVPGVDSTQIGLDSVSSPDPIATPQYTTTYYCLITDASGCHTIRQVVVKIVRDNRIFIPDAFSPNGDGKNDVLMIRGNNIFSARLVVFDRWGTKVFDSDNKNEGWDGTYDGQKLNSAVFTYVASVVFALGDNDVVAKSMTQTGTVALIR